MPVVMLHGLLGSLDNWNGQARRLAKYRTVICVDLRNHGHSLHVKGMSYRNMAEDILALLDYLSIQQCVLMGHSMGGKVAMYLALQYPQRVNRLVVVDIAPKAYAPHHQTILQAMLQLPLADIQSRKQADQWLTPWISSAVDRGFLLKNLKRNSQGFYWQCYLSEIARQYLKIANFPRLSRTIYTAPSLFIAGGQSNYIQAEDTTLIQHYFPTVRIETLAQAGHLPHIEDVEGFYTVLAQFILRP